MEIKVRGARENNLKNVDAVIGDGLTVVTGVSGSGKSSLVFDTIYHQARRRFLDLWHSGSPRVRMAPADVDHLSGMGPAVAVDQNVLNVNPLSTLATASGLHPFLRLLFARFGTRFCRECGTPLSVFTEDEVVGMIADFVKTQDVVLIAPLVRPAFGTHSTLLTLLRDQFGAEAIMVDGRLWQGKKLGPHQKHSISLRIARLSRGINPSKIREHLETIHALGCDSAVIERENDTLEYSMTNVCLSCGRWFGIVEAKHFNMKCEHCEGEGCEVCNETGMHPQAAAVRWRSLTFPKLLHQSVDDVYELFKQPDLPSTGERLQSEIMKRLEALRRLNLGYLQLDRPSPSLSRGESQRVRLAVSLTSRLEDIVHILDEPTIGQHPTDVSNLVSAFKDLPGPVIFVEHDRLAAAQADTAIDLGPRAGDEGGEIIFTGTPAELWESDTTTGEYFSLRKRVPKRKSLAEPIEFVHVKSATKHNLQDISVKIPVGRLTVITGRSGSGKSTLVEHVLEPSLRQEKAIGCEGIESGNLKPVIVNQKPIGKNPRSNPATYTKLSDIIRRLYAQETGLSKSHFSFNRPEGACPTCKGMGATEVKMKYLPSTWIPCSDCEGERYKDEVLNAKIPFGDMELSIADFYNTEISKVQELLADEERLSENKRKSANVILNALVTIGLGYLKLGQPCTTLSGGESQRIKLAKYLGKRRLSKKVIILDEPSTGLHPADLPGLLSVLENLIHTGATVVVVEHNTDFIRSADWVIDLGPGAGPEGGRVLYAGPMDGLLDVDESYTAQALEREDEISPNDNGYEVEEHSDYISVKNATANNLKSVNVDFVKSKLTVVTGVSGSGKSSLVRDVLQAEAERRYLESLSVYERQGTSEGPEAPAEAVTGLGVTLSVSSRQRRGASYWAVYAQRTTVGRITELGQHVNALFASLSTKECMQCGAEMERHERWICPKCASTSALPRPQDFSPSTYNAACSKCSGLGTLNLAAPEKLIIAPEKPICGGAMYSPGYFPSKYFCEETSAASGLLISLGEKYGFDPQKTPWNEISEEGQEAFLFGDDEKLEYSYLGTRKGKRTRVTSAGSWWGFYRLVRDWDVGETFTNKVICDKCDGTGLKEIYLTYKINGYDVHQIKNMTISKLRKLLSTVEPPDSDIFHSKESLEAALKRLEFLEKVGLGYLHLNRIGSTLSAGEAQRIILASLLGSGLTSLTVLIDEPTTGMHPAEVDGLIEALRGLRDEGNTVIVVEHDLSVIQAAEEIVDIGPESGKCGGRIVGIGSPKQMAKANTITGEWLGRKRSFNIPKMRKAPKDWMQIKGAKGNNLQNIDVEIPLGVLCGFCGVSGSGKSTLLIDTIGREIAPKKFSTSVAYESIVPEEFDSIEGAPERVKLLDQGRKGIRSPGDYLGIINTLITVYSRSEMAKAAGLTKQDFKNRCTACKGSGSIKTDLGFLPNVYTTCEVCEGSGHVPEVWNVVVHDYALPELYDLSLEEVHRLFKKNKRITEKLKPALDVGLGYLALKQPSVSLSGGEIQRLKIAKELSKRIPGTLYILDEPTVGQHLEDVRTLIGVLRILVEEGNSVIVIEHHPQLLASCDWLTELGPVGGPDGGRIIAEGTPERISRMETPTAPYLQEVLEGQK